MERRAWLRWARATLGVLAWTLASGARAEAPEAPTLFRIGSGGTGGTYFAVAQLLAAAFSGVGECETEAGCGAPRLLAVAQVSNGSVSNIRDLRNGSLEAGLAQADIAHAAYTGAEPFAKEGPYSGLRAIANLYPETVHLVVRARSDIHSVADLRGRSVSLEEPGSGTLPDALRILKAYGLDRRTVRAVYLKPPLAAKALMEDRLDAFFAVAGHPVPAIADLAAVHSIRLIPIAGPEVKALLAGEPYLSAAEIPAGAYQGVLATSTLAVGAEILVDARMDEALVYDLTRALWSARTREALIEGHPMGREVHLGRALDGLAVPLHPGAARYYREAGLQAVLAGP